jgi:hypothetical protein
VIPPTAHLGQKVRGRWRVAGAEGEPPLPSAHLQHRTRQAAASQLAVGVRTSASHRPLPGVGRGCPADRTAAVHHRASPAQMVQNYKLWLLPCRGQQLLRAMGRGPRVCPGWLPERRIGYLDAAATLDAENSAKGQAIGTARPVWGVCGPGSKSRCRLCCKSACKSACAGSWAACCTLVVRARP